MKHLSYGLTATSLMFALVGMMILPASASPHGGGRGAVGGSAARIGGGAPHVVSNRGNGGGYGGQRYGGSFAARSSGGGAMHIMTSARYTPRVYAGSPHIDTGAGLQRGGYRGPASQGFGGRSFARTRYGYGVGREFRHGYGRNVGDRVAAFGIGDGIGNAYDGYSDGGYGSSFGGYNNGGAGLENSNYSGGYADPSETGYGTEGDMPFYRYGTGYATAGFGHASSFGYGGCSCSH